MKKLYSPLILKDIEQKYGYHISKRLGQNFLIDQNIVNNIIEYAEINKNDLVIEIGPGTGVLTAAAAEKAAMVTAVELDSRLIPVLNDNLSDFDNIRVINKDILKTDIGAIARSMLIERSHNIQLGSDKAGREIEPAKVKILGNLPYYITTAVIANLLEGDIPFSSMTFMMQKEVAGRMCAVNGERECGAITALIRYHSEPKILFNVSREVFIPRPNVDSAVIRFDILENKAVSPINDRHFFRVIRAGFNHRRKTMLNALAGFDGLGKDDIQRAFSIADLAPGRRAESLSLAEFQRLSDALLEVSDDLG